MLNMYEVVKIKQVRYKALSSRTSSNGSIISSCATVAQDLQVQQCCDEESKNRPFGAQVFQVFSVCVFGLCFRSVFSGCVFGLCFRFVFSFSGFLVVFSGCVLSFFAQI